MLNSNSKTPEADHFDNSLLFGSKIARDWILIFLTIVKMKILVLFFAVLLLNVDNITTMPTMRYLTRRWNTVGVADLPRIYAPNLKLQYRISTKSRFSVGRKHNCKSFRKQRMSFKLN
ncbi:hypothetical protein CHUAL_003186 [Chamberlinius hualienensis]